MKKTASIVLILLLCVGVMFIPVSASELEESDSGSSGPDNVNATKYISPQEQLDRYLARTDLTSAQRRAAIQKYVLGQRVARGETLTMATRAVAKYLSVPFYSQLNDYYCGPASVKQTVQYLNNSSDSQAAIAVALGTSSSGTDTNNMANYLNDETSKYYQVTWWWADAAALSGMVITDADKYQPIIAHVDIGTAFGSWPYATEGHYLNYNGYSFSGTTFSVTDPYADRHGYLNGKYTVSSNEAELVTGRLIW